MVQRRCQARPAMTGQDLDPAAFNTIAALIGTVGFPVFIATWVIVRTDKILDRLVVAVEKMTQCVDNLAKRPPQ